MYWSACCGHGLALSTEEFNLFLENYMKACRDEELLDILQSVKDEDVSIEDVILKGANGVMFSIAETNDDTSGFMLVPYHKNEKVNADYDESERRYEDGAYLISPDFDIDGTDYFEREKPYATYDAFVDEFKKKLVPYLPADFDWDDHIGHYAYATYIED